MSEAAVEASTEPVEAPEPADTAPPVEAPEAAAPEAPAAPGFDADAARAFFGTPEGQQVLVEQLTSLIPEDEPAAPEPLDFDPFGDDPSGQLREILRSELGPILEQVLGPVTPALEAAQLGHARTWADEQFSGLPEEVRDLSFKDDESRLDAIFMAKTLGDQGGAPEQAFRQAADRLAARDKRMYEAGLAAARASFEEGDQPAAEPGLASGPAGIRTDPAPRSVSEAAAQIRARRGY